MKDFPIFLLIIPLLLPIINAYDSSKMLIIYFTKTNNTQLFANYIKEICNITESYQIVPVNPYPDNYSELSDLAKLERNTSARPSINNPLTDINKYDIIFLGYPLWHNHIPNILITQIEELDWNGKIIYPFNTHGSKAAGESVDDIIQYAVGADVKEGFSISQQKIKLKEESMLEIKDWVSKNLENKEEKIEEDIISNISLKNIKFHYFIYFLLIILL